MKGDLLQAKIVALFEDVVLLGLVMSPEKQLEVLSFLENIGVKNVYLASDNYQQLKKWLHNKKEPGRQGKMPFPFPAVEALHSRVETVSDETVLVLEEKKGKEGKPMTGDLTQSDIIRQHLDDSYDDLVKAVQEVYPDAKRNNVISMRAQIANKRKKAGMATPPPSKVEKPSLPVESAALFPSRGTWRTCSVSSTRHSQLSRPSSLR
jgi:hypothetical protein